MKSNTGTVEVETTRTLVLDFRTAISGSTPFGRSLQLILQTIERDTGSDVTCLYAYEPHKLKSIIWTGNLEHGIDNVQLELSPASSRWLWSLRSVEDIANASADWRVSSFPEVVMNALQRIAVAPLRMDEQLVGVLTTGWKISQANALAADLISGLSSVASSLLRRVRHSEATCDIVAEIARLEAELADLRIADRASEILAQRDPAQETVKAVHRHIERVLEGTDSASTLKQQLETLRSQVQDRRLVNRAKAFLQKTRRMSEEEAYLHLRNASRRERRPLREIANEVLC